MQKNLAIAGVLSVVMAGGLLAQGGGLAAPDCAPGASSAAFRTRPRRRRTPVSRRTTSISSCRRSSASRSPAATRRSVRAACSVASDISRSVCAATSSTASCRQVDQVHAEHDWRAAPDAPDQGSGASVCRRPTPRSASSRAFPLARDEHRRRRRAGERVVRTDGRTVTTSSITPENNWQFGWGARVGLLSESIVVPASR